MEFWEAYEYTILVQRYFHLKPGKLVTNKHSIAGKPVLGEGSKSRDRS